LGNLFHHSGLRGALLEGLADARCVLPPVQRGRLSWLRHFFLLAGIRRLDVPGVASQVWDQPGGGRTEKGEAGGKEPMHGAAAAAGEVPHRNAIPALTRIALRWYGSELAVRRFQDQADPLLKS